MTVSKEWPKILRNNSNVQQDLNLDTGIFFTTTSFIGQGISEGAAARNSALHHIPLYTTTGVVGQIPIATTQSQVASAAAALVSGGGSADVITGSHHHQHPATFQEQIIGTASGNFLNLALARATDQATLVSLSSVSQNEKKLLVGSNVSQAVRIGMADEPLDQKYFVFNTNVTQQPIPSQSPHQPPTSTSTSSSANIQTHPIHNNQYHGDGSLNVLSLSGVQTLPSLHQGTHTLPMVCVSAASTSTLPAMNELHLTKEQKVSAAVRLMLQWWPAETGMLMRGAQLLCYTMNLQFRHRATYLYMSVNPRCTLTIFRFSRPRLIFNCTPRSICEKQNPTSAPSVRKPSPILVTCHNTLASI